MRTHYRQRQWQHVPIAFLVVFGPLIAWAEDARGQTATEVKDLATVSDNLAPARSSTNFAELGLLDLPLREQVIREALGQPVDFEFFEDALQDVADTIAADMEMPVMLDRAALDAIGIGSDTPVTFSVSNVSLRSALSLMLSQFDCTFTLAHDGLLITTVEANRTSYQRVVRFDIGQLVEQGVAASDLVGIITEMFEESMGEEGTPSVRCEAVGDALVIRATVTKLLEIDRFLSGWQ